MSRNVWPLSRTIRVIVLAIVASGICRAGDSAGLVGSCTSDLPAVCGEGSCGEEAECLTTKYKLLDCNALFQYVPGDEPLLKCLKDQKAGDLTWSAGGEVRYRHMNERNRLRPGGPGQSSYELWRITPFVQLNYNDFIGGYVQAIDASMFGLDAPYTPSQIDVNRTDRKSVV